MREPKLLAEQQLFGKAGGHLSFPRHASRRAAFGNSTGDRQMLEYAQAGGGARLAHAGVTRRRTARVCLRPGRRLAGHQSRDLLAAPVRTKPSQGRLDRHQHEERLEAHFRFRDINRSRTCILDETKEVLESLRSHAVALPTSGEIRRRNGDHRLCSAAGSRGSASRPSWDLLLSGVVIGPRGLDVIGTNRPIADFFADLGKLLLMFSAGLEIDLALFRRARNRVMTFGLLTTVVTTTVRYWLLVSCSATGRSPRLY